MFEVVSKFIVWIGWCFAQLMKYSFGRDFEAKKKEEEERKAEEFRKNYAAERRARLQKRKDDAA